MAELATYDALGNFTGYVDDVSAQAPITVAPADNLNAAIGGLTQAVGTLGNIANSSATYIAEGLKATPLTMAFGYAVEGLQTAANVAAPPIRLAYDAATGAMSSPLDMLATIKPELSGLIDTVKEDPALASALNNAMTQDPTFLPGLVRMSSSSDGGAFLSTVEKGLKNPEVRANLTLGLQNLAEREDIDFSDFEELVGSVREYDMEKPEESRTRVVNAHLAMGLTEDDAEETLAAGRDAFWEDILQNPERLGGWIGNMLEKIGMPAGFAEAVASFIPGMINMIGGAPEFIKDWMGPEYQEFYQNTVKPAAQSAMESGRNNMTLAMNY